MQLKELEAGSRITRGGYEYIVTDTYQSHQGREHRRLINLCSGSPLMLPVDVTVTRGTSALPEPENENEQNEQEK